MNNNGLNRNSPQISRRSSLIWPQNNNRIPSTSNRILSNSNSYNNLNFENNSASGSGSNGRPMMRGSYSSQRISSLANNSPTSSGFDCKLFLLYCFLDE